MKAIFNGIEVECTPDEFAKIYELIGKVEKEVVVRHEYHFPQYPQYPQTTDQYWYNYQPQITCQGTFTTDSIKFPEGVTTCSWN